MEQGKQYLSTVAHLLLPVRQPPAPLLLLFQGFLGGRAQILVFYDLADLFASFGRALVLLLACILSIALPGDIKRDQSQVSQPQPFIVSLQIMT